MSLNHIYLKKWFCREKMENMSHGMIKPCDTLRFDADWCSGHKRREAALKDLEAVLRREPLGPLKLMKAVGRECRPQCM